MCVVSTSAMVIQVLEIREGGSVPQVEARRQASAVCRAKALLDCHSAIDPAWQWGLVCGGDW